MTTEHNSEISLPPRETQKKLADCLEDFSAQLWEHATGNMRRRGDETLTPHDMNTAYRYLLASKEAPRPRVIVCDIAFALGGALFGFALAQLQSGNVLLPAVILTAGLALLVFSGIMKHNF